jgi:hypothetical protein
MFTITHRVIFLDFVTFNINTVNTNTSHFVVGVYLLNK